MTRSNRLTPQGLVDNNTRVSPLHFIGIDPGVSGGIVMLNASGLGASIVAVKMPETERDVFDALDAMIVPGASVAMLERVSASPLMGVVSAFTFGRGYGGLRMALAALGVPYDEVAPIKWQNAMGCRTGGDKNVSKRRAQQLFPTIKVTHAIADALLLAEYCRRSALGLFPQTGRAAHGEKEEGQSEGQGQRKEARRWSRKETGA